MTKRLKSKHKVDRRLKQIFGDDQKVHSILEHTRQANMDKIKKANPQTMEFNYKLNKN